MNQLEQRYIWNSNNDQSFHEVLSSPSFVAKVCLLSEKQACPKQLAQGIRDIIIEAADIGKIKKLKNIQPQIINRGLMGIAKKSKVI